MAVLQIVTMVAVWAMTRQTETFDEKALVHPSTQRTLLIGHLFRWARQASSVKAFFRLSTSVLVPKERSVSVSFDVTMPVSV